MGLVVTLQIQESNEIRMLMTRSRFPKAMGGMMLGISFVFFIMFKAADAYLGILYNLGTFVDKALVFAIISTLIIFSLIGIFLLFYDKKIEVNRKLEEICFRFRFFFPIWNVRVKFDKIDEIIIENVCNSKTIAMQRELARGTGKTIRAGYWLMSLKGKDLGKYYFDRNPKKEVIVTFAENLSRLISKKVTMIER